jgi:hypothetical protein
VDDPFDRRRPHLVAALLEHRQQPARAHQARLSDDEGRTWSEPMLISADGASGDLGYPSTVELADGTLLSVWYETLKDNPLAVLRQAKWRIAGPPRQSARARDDVTRGEDGSIGSSGSAA